MNLHYITYLNNMIGKKSDYRNIPWLHGNIPQYKIENFLSPMTNGFFLVKESTCFPGDYALCLCFNGEIKKYRIRVYETCLTINNLDYFESLESLIVNYQQASHGLCTKLTDYIPKEKRRRIYLLNSAVTIRKTISNGQFGKVLMGIYKSRRVRLTKLVYTNELDIIIKRSPRHENLVKVFGVVYKRSRIYLVTSLILENSLLHVLRVKGPAVIKRKDQLKFALGIIAGMDYLNKMYILHKDLAARNIMISANGVPKITNIGMIENVKPEFKYISHRWAAPEVLKYKDYSEKSDMWSFGIVLWEIYSYGSIPYLNLVNRYIENYISQGKRMSKPKSCPEDVYTFMLQAWNIHPKARPTFVSAKQEFQKLRARLYFISTAMDI